jgi:YegS/Rv2252/BmrU family lipid kinase
MKHYIVVHNPKSGGAATSEIKKAFAKHDIKPQYLTISAPRFNKIFREASKKRGAVVVVAGGDGTINSVTSQLHGTKTPLAIIPVGTLNHFAKALGLPLDIQKAVDAIVHGKQRSVDVGQVNEHIFVNNSSIGFYPRSLRVRDEYDEQIGKWPAAFLAALKVLTRPRHYRVTIEIDGTKQTFRTPFVFIGNNEYQRTQPNLGERATLDSGKLAIYIMKATSPLAIIRMFVHALFTKKRRTQDFAVHLTEKCTIETRHHRRMHVACDGEVFELKTPLRYDSKHKELIVIY